MVIFYKKSQDVGQDELDLLKFWLLQLHIVFLPNIWRLACDYRHL